MRHRSRLLPAAIGVLCAFTIVAGVTVVRLLPGRLALWRPPSVATRQLAGVAPVLGAATGVAGAAGGATAAGVSQALAPFLSSAALGQSVGVLVTNLTTGQVLYASNASTGFTPASTNKLATAVAALTVLGPAARLTTKVVTGTANDSIVLVGGGDPTLAAGHPPAADYPQPATLVQLASLTARALRARGERSVQLGFDTSLYTGPGLGPGWPASYVTTGNVSVITPLEVDQGRVTASGVPVDADLSGGLRSADPAQQAADVFAGYLAADGITVRGAGQQVTAPAGAATLASVQSPPLAEIVQWMLEESNNVIAENLARQVAIATGQPASFSGAAAAVTSVLRRLGVTGNLQLYDGSGLSPQDEIAPAVLVQLIRLAATTARLRSVLTGLPVDGFSGTLQAGASVFGPSGGAGLGVVRAKTGNLSTVAALAGSAYARNGQLLAFAVMADEIPPAALNTAAAQMVGLASVLAGCGCQ
ncbi:MAG TPA: D-alanyl-D-alanine carboxypeptidase/D-alanyl-D-alanine-endopeptidase [Streptosporangiaceae bacterium]|nr:D-alanyl-D-alanine carboxypeptidase/D-alanyl-D-alanine-endopeptidase [Streptosporangiaceae bacterium]